MLHRLRSVLVRPDRERLTGVVEVDETYIGGEEPGLRGGRAKGKKLLVGIAVERRQPRGLGRCRMAVLPDAKTDTLRAFLADHVEEGATVITDGWQPYRAAAAGRYLHQATPAPAGRRTRRCPACTGSPRWPSDGCWAPTRAPRTTPTCPATSTSSSSASTAAAPAAAAWSSTASSSSPSLMSRCATATSCSTPGPRPAHGSLPAREASHRRWTARRRDGHGEPRTSAAPVRWIPQTALQGEVDPLG
jgi:transposase-like protein